MVEAPLEVAEPAGVVISVRGEAQRTVAPDSVLMSASISIWRSSKPEALSAAATALDRLTDDMAALGGVALTVGNSARRSPGRRFLPPPTPSANTTTRRGEMSSQGDSLPPWGSGSSFEALTCWSPSVRSSPATRIWTCAG